MANYEEFNLIEGLQFIPIQINKVPIVQKWQEGNMKYDLSNCPGIGLVCGSPSGGVEGMDFDLKYDLSGTLMDDYIQAVNEVDPNIIPKLFVQRTQSGGYHLVYKVEGGVVGNHKIARRNRTAEEIDSDYLKDLKKELHKKGNPTDVNSFEHQSALKIAEKSRTADRPTVLIETRGQGGQIACWPTPGYTVIQGRYENIPTISSDEREILHSIAFSFNQYYPTVIPYKNEVKVKKQVKGLTPSEDFNERGDVVGLLEQHGWTTVKRQGSKILMRRPGDTSAKTSGNYDEELKWFSVFSTSTCFESEKPYKPYAVFAMLECSGDFSQVTKKLAELGYGDPLEKTREARNEVPSIIDMSNDEDYSFLSSDDEDEDYLERWRTGTFEMGLSTGIPDLDNQFRFKKGNLVITNGIDNVGKSLMLWYLIFLSSYIHGSKALFFSSENRIGHMKKKIMEFYWCKRLMDMSDEEYAEAKVFLKDHFKFIKNGAKLFNYMDIINMAKKTNKIFKIDSLLIDPYNSLKVENKGKSYEYHYESLSDLKLFGDNEKISIYLNAHAGTTAARSKDKDKYTLAPGKEDTEMGVMGGNKADEFLTVHRLTDHETDYIYTELHVRKVKETETGGRPTHKFKPLYFRPVEGLVGFIQIKEKSISASGINPVLTIRENKKNIGVFEQYSLKDLPPVIQSAESQEDPF